MEKFSLDELYYMTASIYSEQNLQRTSNTTLTHFVEVCGMLTINCGHKKQEKISFEDAMCKALGWFFPLLSRFKIKSVQEVIFMKYPYACPYCRKTPHSDESCKTLKGTLKSVNHNDLKRIHKNNIDKMPSTLSEWQKMFQDIYPRSPRDMSRSAIGLLEELGELAEAIRVFDQYPKYFIGEVADVFSYLMGFANEYNVKCKVEGRRPFEFEKEYLKRFPGICSACGNSICICPAVPEATIGRMAKELDISKIDDLFLDDNNEIISNGTSIGKRAFTYAGGFKKIFEELPIDRGDVNKDLVVICLKISELIKDKNAQAASQLNSAALKIAQFQNKPGSIIPKEKIKNLCLEIIELLKQYPDDNDDILALLNNRDPDSPISIETLIKATRVLVVISNPLDRDALFTDGEVKTIIKSIERSIARDEIDINVEPSPTKDDLRRIMLEKDYDIIHFAGHGEPNGIVLVDEYGNAETLSIDILEETILRGHDSIKCIIFNSCFTLSEYDSISTPANDYTIVGIENKIDDDIAIKFTKGFYDAIGAKKDIESAIQEGIRTVKLAKNVDLQVKIIRPDKNNQHKDN